MRFRFFITVAAFAAFGILGTFSAQSQGMDKGHHIEFYAGAGFPVGGFGKPLFSSSYYENGKQATLNFHGAKIGASYGLVADFYVINDYLGVLINVNANTHSLQAAATYPGEYFFRPLKPVWTTTVSGSWHSIQALLGITARYPVVDWLLFTGRAAIGYSHFVVPFFSADVTTQNRYVYSQTLTTPSKGGFGYLAGVGLEFCITPSFGIHLRSDYVGSSAIAFKGNKAAQSVLFRNNEPLSEPNAATTFEFNEMLQVVNVNIGLSIAF
ncbi:MAG: hypothetical protein LBC49_05680 [Bacteroidales bacterium]|jgi:hypothetical protein|nr:hypothetical protein [Bacteroidales bacterium]